jgi:hypothetical protein
MLKGRFSHRIDLTKGRLLGFAYDFGVTVAMFLASALTANLASCYSLNNVRGIQPPDNIQNGRHSGGKCLL